MFAYERSKFERVELMSRENNACDAYEDVIGVVGSSNNKVTDNTTILKGLIWTGVNRIY